MPGTRASGHKAAPRPPLPVGAQPSSKTRAQVLPLWKRRTGRQLERSLGGPILPEADRAGPWAEPGSPAWPGPTCTPGPTAAPIHCGPIPASRCFWVLDQEGLQGCGAAEPVRGQLEVSPSPGAGWRAGAQPVLKAPLQGRLSTSTPFPARPGPRTQSPQDWAKTRAKWFSCGEARASRALRVRRREMTGLVLVRNA